MRVSDGRAVLSRTSLDLPSIALGGSKLAAFISPASCTVVGTPRCHVRSLGVYIELCCFLGDERSREIELSSTRKLPALGLPYFSSTSTVWVVPFWFTTLVNRDLPVQSVVVINRLVCAG